MDALPYQGLFYLSAGLGIFLSLLFGLRILGLRQERQLAKARLNSWSGKEPLEIVEHIEECAEIVTLRLKRKNARPFPTFLPGQFLSLQIGASEKQVRSYSICSSAVTLDTVEIAIKLLANGVGSTWMHGLKVGDQVWAYPPSGQFTEAEVGEAQRVFVAGGIGITPILAMILTNVDLARRVEMVLFYGMRTRQDLAFHEVLKSLAKRHLNFKYFPVLSHDATAPGEFDQGFLSYEYMVSKVELQSDAHFFVCGPSVMADVLLDQLKKNGVAGERVHSERFASPVVFDSSQVPRRRAEIFIDNHKYNYDGQQTVLEFLETQGLELPFACRVGVCGSCRCITQDPVTLITDAGLSSADKQNHYFLTCVAFPAGETLRISRGP